MSADSSLQTFLLTCSQELAALKLNIPDNFDQMIRMSPTSGEKLGKQKGPVNMVKLAPHFVHTLHFPCLLGGIRIC